MPPGRARAVRDVYGLRCSMVESQEEGGVRVRGRVRGAARGTLALGQHTSPRAQKRELTSVKARAQESDRRAMDVGSGVRSRREMHAPRRGQCVVTHLPPTVSVPDGACAHARAQLGNMFSLRQADLPEILLRSRRELQENGFWASARAWFKGLNFFIFRWTCTFSGGASGGGKIRRQLQPALGCTSPPTAARKLNTYALRATGSVGGRSIPRPSPESVQRLRA